MRAHPKTLLAGLAAASLTLGASTAMANETLDQLVCKELEWHHAKATEKWHEIDERAPSKPIPIEGRLAVFAPLKFVHDFDRAMEAHALTPVEERIAMLRLRARDRDCAWLDKVS